MELGKSVERVRSFGKDDRRKTREQIDDEARQVFEMALAGMRTDQIAEALGISIGTVSNRRKRGSELAVVPAVEELRNEANARLDGAMVALLRDNPKFNPRVAEAFIAIETRRAKLNGFDRPTQVEITQTIIEGGIDAEVAKLAEEMGLAAEAVAEMEDAS